VSYTPIGLPVAKEVLEAMRLATARFWYEWGAYYERASPEERENLQRELQEILEACRAGGGSGPSPGSDDHLVLASNVDPTAPGGLIEKTGPSASITPELYFDPVTGIQRVRFNAAPVTPPAGQGSWLYTGSIQASDLFDPVKSFVKSLEGMGGLDPGQSELFNVLESGDYEHKAVGQLYGLAPDGTQTFALSQGQRVWLAMWQGASDNVWHGGMCTVQTIGDGSTKAVLHPTADDLQVGSMFKVDGDGAQFEDWYWEILSLPDKTLAYRPDYASTTTYNLFTGTQVHLAGTTTRETSVTIPGGTSGGTLFAIPVFEMFDTLGVSTIKKGVVNWELLAYVVSDDPAATVQIRALLSTNLGIDHNFAYANSPPIHATSPTIYRCQGTIPADLAVNPSDVLSACFYGYSNSANEVTIRLVYNDAGHTTRVQTTVETASYGTLDHQLLTAASRKFTPEQVAAAARSCHPRRSVEDFASVPLSFSGGNLTPDPTADTTILTTEVTIERIDSSQWPGGFCRSHRLYFVGGGYLVQGQSPSGDFLGMSFGNFGGLSDPKSSTIRFYPEGQADLMLIGGAWHLGFYKQGRKPTS